MASVRLTNGTDEIVVSVQQHAKIYTREKGWTPVGDDPAQPAPRASTAKWREYADGIGVEYDDDATKSQIIALVKASRAEE